jgi:hypothetical protein
VDRARQQLLAGAALAQDQHRRNVAGRNLCHHREHVEHAFVAADHAAHGDVLGQLLAELPVLFFDLVAVVENLAVLLRVHDAQRRVGAERAQHRAVGVAE